MKAVILAAGKGTRLCEMTAKVPKCLVPVNGRPILEYQLRPLEAAGIRDILVVTGYCSDQVEAYSRGRFRTIRNEDYAATNSICSLWLARDEVDECDFILFNGDVLADPQLIRNLINCSAPCAALIDNRKVLVDGEMNVIIHDEKISEFSKNVRAVDADGESVQITKFGKREASLLFARIEQVIGAGETQRFPAFAYDVIFEQSEMRPVYVNNHWYFEIDTPEDYEKCIQAIG